MINQGDHQTFPEFCLCFLQSHRNGMG